VAPAPTRVDTVGHGSTQAGADAGALAGAASPDDAGGDAAADLASRVFSLCGAARSFAPRLACGTARGGAALCVESLDPCVRAVVEVHGA